MRRRWIIPLDTEGRAEIIITKEGRLWMDVTSIRHTMSQHTTIWLSEEQRLELIKVLQDAGRSRAGIKMPNPVIEEQK